MTFTLDELKEAIALRKRDFLDAYLEWREVEPCVREFLLQSKPNREGKRSATKVENDHRLARAKLLYKELRQAGHDVEQARAEMRAQFPMASETAVRLTEGSFPHINRLCEELATPTD